MLKEINVYQSIIIHFWNYICKSLEKTSDFNIHDYLKYIIGGIVAILLLIMFTYCCCMKKRKDYNRI